MLDRHLLRSIALQSLFEWDARDDINKTDIHEILAKNIEDFAQTSEVPPFAEKIINCILEKQKELDNIIKQAAPQWPIDKIPVIDRNILRIGICELLFSDRKEVPPKVAINEAIELSKAFGGENSSKFISGVLGTIYKELGEPQKHETSKNKKDDTPYEKMPIEKKCGAMVYSIHDNNLCTALVHDIFGHWTLSKGGLEEGESEKECAVREAKEKMGLDIEIIDKIGENEYIANSPKRGKVRRQVIYYLAKAEHDSLSLQKGDESGGLDNVKWFKLNDLSELNLYNDIVPIIEKGKEILKTKDL
ncbi:MAG: transcription antitermination factor NusB [Candidatus Pacebacteria bacterium]|nr:transcription antitermination factor NusB [Candidatus Paceibacterota bacterium]